jgi:hypothetical protein
VAHGTIIRAATGAAAETANLWISIGSGTLAIILGARGFLKRFRRHSQPDVLPPRPPPLPTTRVSSAQYRQLLQEWEIYSAHVDQYFKDQRGQNQ